MIHEAVAVGPLACNCHVLADEESREAVVIDPGDDADEILARVRKRGLAVRHLLHTHCHFDHMSATRRVKEETGAAILIHRADKAYYDGLVRQYERFGLTFGAGAGGVRDPLPVDRFLEDGQRIRFGRHELEVLFTPGHTEGSCSFHLEGSVFSGDTLFCRGVGRTDLPGGSRAEEESSIRKRLYTLDPETAVYPGHGPETTIGEEREENPFVRG